MPPIKLHLGSGLKKLHGFINIDIRPETNPDICYDITKISELFKNEVELILSIHTLEHFPRKKMSYASVTYLEVLKIWYNVLKPGGKIYLSVPNFEAICNHYIKNADLSLLYGFLYGGQKNDFDQHFHCFDFETLKQDLSLIGFSDIKKYDWRQTEWNYIDSYEQSYLPHLDKINGSLMSLNIEATK